ncbi:MAG TPA: DUF4177 domain-containing protein [Arenimonas sp.]|uniref:DUF4177 domain-containing protein n=1 Tax=Arenimonas sp. TaxID=1872635 RepID=UPI002C830E4B|nr:DUF4177 domain-containing protein [Arenimonas sp.]HMB57385.1 DUF4177 domain-containing protein [Arenimonas sp.]
MTANTRWQYQVVDIRLKIFGNGKQHAERLQEELNRQGLQGWELVSLLPLPGTLCYRASFKRAA